MFSFINANAIHATSLTDDSTIAANPLSRHCILILDMTKQGFPLKLIFEINIGVLVDVGRVGLKGIFSISPSPFDREKSH